MNQTKIGFRFILAYLILFLLEETNDGNDTDQSDRATILLKDNELKMQFVNLNKVVQLSLKMGCWHVYLENQSDNPFYTSMNNMVYNPCIIACPFCDGTMRRIAKLDDFI
jgi:hypothetical protein